MLNNICGIYPIIRGPSNKAKTTIVHATNDASKGISIKTYAETTYVPMCAGVILNIIEV